MALEREDLTRITIGGTLFNYACERQTNSCVRRRIAMHEPIQVDKLLQAMELTRKRYPQLSLALSKTKTSVSETYTDEPFRLNGLDEGFLHFGQDTNGHMITFYVENDVLLIDFFHAIADDVGMDRFIQTLLHTYLKLAGYPVDDGSGSIVTCDTSYDPAEGEDAGARLLICDSHARPSVQPRRAFKVRGRRRTLNEPDFAYTLRLDLREFKEFSRRHDATPTAVVSTMFSRILFRHYSVDLMESAPPITAEIAVNMRNHFPTQSVRNFVGNAYLTYNRVSDRSEIDEVLTKQTASLRAQNTPAAQAACYRHAFHMADRWFRESSLPVYAKNWMHKHIAVKAMSGGMTYGISNIGKVQLPDCLQAHVAEYYTMVPSGLHSYLISMRSQGNDLILCITSKLLDSGDVVAQFAEMVRRNGIGARVVRTEDFYYTKYVQNLAVTPAFQNKIDLSPAMDQVLLAIEDAQVAARELRLALHRRFA